MMDLPIWLYALIGLIFVLALVVNGSELKNHFAYSLKPSLLSPAERSFFGVLSGIVGADAWIFTKVRVADIVAPQKGMGRSSWQSAFNRISSKHFDFVLCSKSDVSVICVIELNDSSHRIEKRKKRDALLREICDSANLPMMEFAVQRSYNVEEVRGKIKDAIERWSE